MVSHIYQQAPQRVNRYTRGFINSHEPCELRVAMKFKAAAGVVFAHRGFLFVLAKEAAYELTLRKEKDLPAG